MLLTALLACGRGGRVENVDTQYGEVQVGDVSLSFGQILPGDCQHVQTYAFTGEADENYDGRPDREWVVLYRFDLPAEGDRSGSPIGAAVYRLSTCRPPCLVPYELRPPEGEYLCECDCSADRADIFPRTDRPELIFRDRCEGEVARLSGMPRAARRVSQAMRRAPRGVNLPWHRVINAQGKISFPEDSSGWKRQKNLLEAEGVVFLNGKINLEKYGYRGAVDRLLWGEEV